MQFIFVKKRWGDDLRICFITTMVYKDGGVSRVLSALASRLSAEYDVTVATFEDSKYEDRKKYNLSKRVKVDFLEPYYRKCYVRRAIHKINQKTGLLNKVNSSKLWNEVYIPEAMKKYWRKYIEDNQYDVVIGVQGKCAYILGSMATDLTCKTIGWQHNSYEAYFEQPGRNYYWNQDFLFEKYIPKLDYYIVLNEHDERMLKEKKNINAITIYNPRSFISKEKSDVTAKRFLGVGGLRPAKGFDLLIESFEIFAKNDSEWILDIYGDGDEREHLQKIIDEKKLRDRVRLKGVTRDICPEMLHSSALLLSSRWEGMPMVVLEALETGLPVISYDITAIEPLITNGVEGYIVERFDTNAFADAMTHIADDIEIRKCMGRFAAEKSVQFDIERIVDCWKKILEG